MLNSLIFFFVLAVVVSFLCSLLEAVILSVTPAYISVQKKLGKKSGVILAWLKEEIDKPLAAILTLNTVANTVGAAGIGAQVNKLYGHELVAIASGILTLIILIFSEILPKTLGSLYWKSLAPMCAYMIRGLVFVLYPFVLMSRMIRSLMTYQARALLTREEMLATAEIGGRDGTLKQNEIGVIRNLLMLDNIKVSDIMTPRSVIYAFPETAVVDEIMDKQKPIRFSRIPIYHQNLDHVTGLVHRYRIMEAYSHDQENMMLREFKTEIHSVPEDVTVAQVIDLFLKRKEHLFLVTDVYGTTAGLVTLEDAIETLLGVEIVDEYDSVADMREYALEQWRKRKAGLRAVPES